MPLVIRLTRVSPTHHRFALERPDGTSEARELETKTFLLHDLVHFALESEAGLRRSFYGRLAQGAAYADFAEPAAAAAHGPELLTTELLAGALQKALVGAFDPAAFRARFVEYLDSIGETPPAWLTVELLKRVQAHLRTVLGRWRATPFGAPMELRFDLPEVPDPA